VNCVCGAPDDDGERMQACECCVHTRCLNTKDAEDVPKKLVCRLCKGATKKNDSVLRVISNEIV
jgi:hypothetical protein